MVVLMTNPVCRPVLLHQALMAAVSIPRSAALDALKAAGGDAAAALAWQLMRFRLNSKKVDALAWEYAVARCARAAARTPLCVVVLVYS